MSKKNKTLSDELDHLDEQIESWIRKTDARKYPKTDWEKLCGQLQEALAKEIKENDEHEQIISDLTVIVHYLEMKLGIYKHGYEPV